MNPNAVPCSIVRLAAALSGSPFGVRKESVKPGDCPVGTSIGTATVAAGAIVSAWDTETGER